MLSAELKENLRKQRLFFDSGITRPLAFRLQKLEALADQIKKNEETIFEALHADLKKPRFEAYVSEISFIYQDIAHTIKHLKHWVKPERVSTPLVHFKACSEIHYEPLGVVLIISPWNYPFQLLLSPLIGALAAGNCVVAKPSELAPHTSKVLAEILSQTFSGDYVFIVEGGITETQQLLEEKFDHIFFTGSTAVGKIVMTAAAQHLTPVTLELGGKSPCIVDADADLETSVRRITWGKFFNAGQTCVAPDYLLVHESIKDAFIKRMTSQITEFYGTDPEKSQDYARIINEKHFKRLCKLLETAKVVYGGKTNLKENYLSPTLVSDVSLNDSLMKEEIFGPILPILSFQTIDQAKQVIENFSKPLALYLFSKSSDTQKKIFELSFGGGCLNDTMVHLSNPDLPFGGVGSSGMGAYHGKESFLTFSHRKSILKKTFFPDIKLRYPSYENKLSLVRKILG